MVLTPPKGVNKANILQRWIGLEIELVPVGNFRGIRLPPYLRYTMVRDGSITPPGQEMVVSPLIGDQFVQGIGALAEGLARAGSGVDASCGFHVHVGAKDFGSFELRRLVTLYTKLEVEIFQRFTTPERIQSRFCKPYEMGEAWFEKFWAISDPSELRKFILCWLYGEKLTPMLKWDPENDREILHPSGGFSNSRRLRDHKYEECRYHGLNLHSWMQRNTIEWRHHQGTIDPSRLMYWPLFCAWVTEMGSALRDNEVREIHTLNDLLKGEWKRPFCKVAIPSYIKDWVESL